MSSKSTINYILWKLCHRANPGLENVKNLSPSKKKRESSSLEDLVQNPKESKRKKIEAQSEEGAGKEVFTDGEIGRAHV